jgi:hypothetical protein
LRADLDALAKREAHATSCGESASDCAIGRPHAPDLERCMTPRQPNPRRSTVDRVRDWDEQNRLCAKVILATERSGDESSFAVRWARLVIARLDAERRPAA